MVKSWSPESPEPSKCVEFDGFSVTGEIQLDSDSDEDDDIVPSNFGYQLLPGEPLVSNLTEADNDNENEAQTERNIPVESSVDSNVEVEQRADIQVNPDEVRRIMSNISLPTSSFPSWASNLDHESQWTPWLVSRLNTIQENSK